MPDKIDPPMRDAFGNPMELPKPELDTTQVPLLPTHDLTADEFFFLETIVQVNAGAAKAGEDSGSTPIPNDLLHRLITMARKPHDEGRAMRFLAVQTEAFIKCQNERDVLRVVAEAARACDCSCGIGEGGVQEHGYVDTDEAPSCTVGRALAKLEGTDE